MSGGEGALDTPGGPLNDSGEKYAVCFFDNNNTVGKHLFFLIQSILLFHDRCCFTFFQLVLYMYDYNDKNTVGNIYFSYSKYIIFSNKF